MSPSLMPSGKGQPSPAPSKRLNVSRTVEAAMPSRRAISRVEIPAENFKRMISRTWRIATLSAGIIAPLDCQRRDPKQASGGARRHSRPRAASFRSGGRHHLVMVGGIIPLRRATSSRYDGRLGQESAVRYGEAFWRAHHEAWQQSALNQREYCEAHGIPLKAFGNWRAKFKAEPQLPA